MILRRITMKKLSFLILFAVSFLLFDSCRKIESLPPVPHIEYRSFEVFDTTDPLGNGIQGGKLRFYFEDGDGDIGIVITDGQASDTNNLVFTLYRKTGGEMQLAPEGDPLLPSSYRIPYMEREGINKILKGIISVTFLYHFYTQEDTIQYDFYITDRAGNQSNVATTNEIIISENNTY